MDAVKCNNIQRMRLLGHVIRMEEGQVFIRLYVDVGEGDDHVNVGGIKFRKLVHLSVFLIAVIEVNKYL